MTAATRSEIGHPTAEPFSVSVAHTVDDRDAAAFLERLGEEAVASAFQRPTTLRAVYNLVAKPNGGEPLLVLVHGADGAPQALFPFVRVRRGGLMVVEAPDFDICDYWFPLIAGPGRFNPSQALALWHAVTSALKPAHAVFIKKMPATLYGRENPLAGLPQARPMGAVTSILPLRGPADEVLTDVHGISAVREAAKKARRLGREGALAFDEVRDPERAAALVDRMAEFRSGRFDGLGRRNALAREEVRAFYRERAREGVGDGSVRVLELSIGGETLGASLLLVHGSTVVAVLIVMSPDPKWDAFSPGTIATAKTIQWAWDSGFAIFDLSVGALSYKSRFGVEEHALLELNQALTLRGRLAVAPREILRRLRCIGRDNPRVDAMLRGVQRRWVSRRDAAGA